MAAAAGSAAEKKSIHAAEQDRPDVAAARAVWHEQLKDVDPARLVFLDESGAQTSMTRTRGRAPKGQRVLAKVPGGHWIVVTMIGAIRLEGPFAAATVVGATDSDVFRSYVTKVLAPALRAGDVVVMDNLSPHKAAGVREAIESAGASLRYLPRTARTSTRSRTAGARSSGGCGRSAPARSRPCTKRSARPWPRSAPTTATASSAAADTLRRKTRSSN